MTTSPWRLEQSAASLRLGNLTAEVDAARPECGIYQIALAGEPIRGRILQIPAESSTQCAAPISPAGGLDGEQLPLETYVRQEDLVATYAQQPSRPFRRQLYWRALPLVGEAPPGIELIVSAQTSLLDSRPELHVRSALATAELWRSTGLDQPQFKQLPIGRAEPLLLSGDQGPACFLWRLANRGWSYAEMLPPSDYHSSILARDDEFGLRLTHRLFVRPLEKGVILRARLRGFFLPRARDASAALDCYRLLLDSKLPLTT